MNYKKIKKIDIIIETILIVIFLAMILLAYIIFPEEKVNTMFPFFIIIFYTTILLYFYIRERIFIKILKSSFYVTEKVETIYPRIKIKLINNDFSLSQEENKFAIYEKKVEKGVKQNTRFIVFEESFLNIQENINYIKKLYDKLLEEKDLLNKKDRIYCRNFLVFYESSKNKNLNTFFNSITYYYPYNSGYRAALPSWGDYVIPLVFIEETNEVLFGETDNNPLLFEKTKEELMEFLNINIENK